MVEPWLQQPGEGDTAFVAFTVYRDIGPGRTLDAAYRAHAGLTGPHAGAQEGTKRAPGGWKRWYSQHNWRTRAEAFDARLERATTEARVNRARELGAATADVWAERFERQREAEWRASRRALRLARRQIKALEDQEKIDADKVTPGGIAKLLEVHSTLGRLALGKPTVHAQVDTEKLRDMSDEDLERIAAGEHAAVTRH